MEFEQCEHTYAHHPHIWFRGWERSVSEAPQCQGVPNDEAPETDEAE